ncbi:hypothetical protein CI109_107198 [Kwoniella shandongensis]|uniref:Uncharacterized protein n=1 Tax=Kwoniella shandongensis TaxID=1734106 RepID=A0A5M6C3A4_9TREE|nr:uncharacterized protein CI109_002481 [Kwoniella shandongensis]KAA5529140.1 hypothetical protein CI109_002481 [Kwoniella shandongensis]
MSYFSDTSSSGSAPPLTPSPTSATHPPIDYSSPTPYTLVSPPDSLRQYSSALKQRMTAGLTAAMKDLKDDRGGPERKFDVEYGYDENPIDRHVMMHLTPRKLPERSKAVPELGLLPLAPTTTTTTSTKKMDNAPQVQVHVRMLGTRQDVFDERFQDADTEMLGSSPSSRTENGMDDDDNDLIDQDPVPMRYRPGLIHFHRSNSSSLARPSYSRMNSNVSTGSNVSMMSEASFEAVRAEDIVSMYGGASGTKDDEKMNDNDNDEEQEYIGRSSMESTESRETLRPTSSSCDYTLRVRSTHSSSSSLTFVPPVPITITPAPAVPSPAPVQSQQRQHAPSLHSRPSLLRPRPRVSAAHPYDNNTDNAGGRTFSKDGGEPEWLAGRTVSERMVAQAGLRCQRQRVGTVRAGAAR